MIVYGKAGMGYKIMPTLGSKFTAPRSPDLEYLDRTHNEMSRFHMQTLSPAKFGKRHVSPSKADNLGPLKEEEVEQGRMDLKALQMRDRYQRGPKQSKPYQSFSPYENINGSTTFDLRNADTKSFIDILKDRAEKRDSNN
jgi:hypothetical protein